MKEIFKDELLHFSLQTQSEAKVDFLTEKYGKVQVNPAKLISFTCQIQETGLNLTVRNISL